MSAIYRRDHLNVLNKKRLILDYEHEILQLNLDRIRAQQERQCILHFVAWRPRYGDCGAAKDVYQTAFAVHASPHGHGTASRGPLGARHPRHQDCGEKQAPGPFDGRARLTRLQICGMNRCGEQKAAPWTSLFVHQRDQEASPKSEITSRRECFSNALPTQSSWRTRHIFEMMRS